jgi:predicted dithiol-disulfide oxidoreductase (DUF899 family)
VSWHNLAFPGRRDERRIGQDSRGAPDLLPLRTILDATPEGRGSDWHPKPEY